VLRPNVPLPRYDQPSSTVVQHARSASVSQPNLPVPQRGWVGDRRLAIM